MAIWPNVREVKLVSLAVKKSQDLCVFTAEEGEGKEERWDVWDKERRGSEQAADCASQLFSDGNKYAR